MTGITIRKQLIKSVDMDLRAIEELESKIAPDSASLPTCDASERGNMTESGIE